MKFKCRDCGEVFKEWEVSEWLNDDDIEDDEDGYDPCCPCCGSDNVEEC